MPNQDDLHNGLKLTDRATLSLLSALEDDSAFTQRSLAQRIGVALGLTNSLLKRAVRKGLVKVTNAPAKRYAYYVTPKGFSEKSRLVAEYLSVSLNFFRQAREEFDALYVQAQQHGHRRIALYGAGELAEIASLSAHQSNIELCGVIAPGSNQSQFAGVPVYTSVKAALADGVEAVFITVAENPQEHYDKIVEILDQKCVYAASMLHIRPKDGGGS